MGPGIFFAIVLLVVFLAAAMIAIGAVFRDPKEETKNYAIVAAIFFALTIITLAPISFHIGREDMLKEISLKLNTTNTQSAKTATTQPSK